MTNFIDRSGEQDFFDDTPTTPVTLWVDRTTPLGVFLGLGGVDPVGTSVFPLMLMLRLRIHAAWLLFMLIPSF